MDNSEVAEGTLGTTASQPTDNPNAMGQCRQVHTQEERHRISGAVVPAALYPVNGEDKATEDGVRMPNAVHYCELALLRVMLDQRRCLGLVQIEPGVDGFRGVVVTLDNVTTAVVTGPWTRVRTNCGEVLLTVAAEPTRGQPFQHHLARNIKVHGEVDRSLRSDFRQRLSLGHGARKAVEQIAPTERIGALKAIPHDTDHDVVANQAAIVDDRLGLLSELSALGDISPKNVTSGDMWHDVVPRETGALRAFSGTLSSENDQSGAWNHSETSLTSGSPRSSGA